MTRVQAADYEEKKSKLLDAAALLFAKQGYAGSRMEQIAAECNVSKSMLYHYFKKKEDVLFCILQEHITNLISDFETFLKEADRSDKKQFFCSAVSLFLRPTKIARASHVVALHDVRYLTKPQRMEQERLERVFLVLMEEILRIANPKLREGESRIPAFLFVGMLNSVELWYKRTGRVSPEALDNLITQIYLNGVASLDFREMEKA